MNSFFQCQIPFLSLGMPWCSNLSQNSLPSSLLILEFSTLVLNTNLQLKKCKQKVNCCYHSQKKKKYYKVLYIWEISALS